MLQLPERGFARSINSHNVDLTVLSDWIEGSIMFSDVTVSFSDVVDALCSEEIYDDQTFASQMVQNAFGELARRQRLLEPNGPYIVARRRIERAYDWTNSAAHSFCMAVTFMEYYETWRDRIATGRSYVEQGDIFESIAFESLKQTGWEVFQTGWASGIRSAAFSKIVDRVASELNETYKSNDIVELYAEANEEGLDLVCYRPFPDNRGGKPIYLVQCASGKRGGNWRSKLKTPDLDLWSKFILFSSAPNRAFITPFAFDDSEFFKVCNRVNGMLLDRYRLLLPTRNISDWLSRPLADRIVKWLKPRLKSLPVV